MRRGILFFFNSVVTLQSTRLLPWRSRCFYFKGEALTASVRRSNATFTAKSVNIPADLNLDSPFVKDLLTLYSQLSLPTAGTRSTLINRLKEARETQQNAQSVDAPTPVQNDSNHMELQQQFQQLQ